MASISTLPVEIRISILRELSDIGDLSRAVSSHESLAEALRVSPTVVGHVLRNEIDPRLWPLAVTIWQIQTSRKKIEVYTDKDASVILEECQSTTPQDAWEHLSRVDLDEAQKYFHQLHRAIDNFTTGFISQALDSLAMGGVLEHSPSSPSPNEIYRVQRTFYYFEFLCHIFGDGPYAVAWDEQWALPLYMGFDPWMNEQLASVYEYLLSQLSIALDKPAAHDIELGFRKITWLETSEFLVSCGIPYIYDLAVAPTHEDRRRLVAAKKKPRGFLNMLNIAFEDLNHAYYHERYSMAHPLFGAAYMTSLHTGGYLYTNDEELGPADIWCQAHLADDYTNWGLDFVLSKHYADERRAGYVMCDPWRKLDFENFSRSKVVSNSCTQPE